MNQEMCTEAWLCLKNRDSVWHAFTIGFGYALTIKERLGIEKHNSLITF